LSAATFEATFASRPDELPDEFAGELLLAHAAVTTSSAATAAARPGDAFTNAPRRTPASSYSSIQWTEDEGFESHGGPKRRPGRVAAAMWSGSRSRLTTSATVRFAEAACSTTYSETRPFSSFAAAAGRRVVGRRLWESEPVFLSAQEAGP
jgi:hypothetical protein